MNHSQREMALMLKKLILTATAGLLLATVGATAANADTGPIPEPIGGSISLTVDDVQYGADGECVYPPVRVSIQTPDDYAYWEYAFTSTYDGPTTFPDEISGSGESSGVFNDTFDICPEWDSPGTYEGSLEVTFYDAGGNEITTAYASDTFRVLAYGPPAVNVANVTASPQTFYPLVRDGYRDSTAIRWHQNIGANISVEIKSLATGRTVRRQSLGSRGSGYRTWSWNGRKGNGTLVKTGRYRVIVLGQASGHSDRASTTVTVATGWRSKSHTLHRSGTNTSSRSASSSCYISGYAGELELDCWGGSYAKATYGFGVPSNAVNIRRSINKGLSSSDLCCSGSISATWSGNVATVRVSGWRAVNIYGVTIRYTTRTRI